MLVLIFCLGYHLVENFVDLCTDIISEVVRHGLTPIFIPSCQTTLQEAWHFVDGGYFRYIKNGSDRVHAQSTNGFRVIVFQRDSIIFSGNLSKTDFLVHAHINHGAF